MREVNVSINDAGQRFDKYLFKYFKEAPSSFIYKMLRKKNIVLNGRKSDGKDILNSGDVIKIFMAEETIEKFAPQKTNNNHLFDENLCKKMPNIIFENDDIMIIDKPAGMLSQKSEEDSVSLNEICLSYLYYNHFVSDESLKTFTPSICNRLDRNTSGMVFFAKTYAGANYLSKVLRDRSVHKYYKCLVKGRLDKEMLITGHLSKNESNNKVSITDSGNENNIYTKIYPILSADKYSLVEILLITGKTHQIRAHLASIGHPIIGDYKYGDRALNDYYKKNYNVRAQLLCAYKVIFPFSDGQFEDLSMKTFEIEPPKVFERIIKDGNLEK